MPLARRLVAVLVSAGLGVLAFSVAAAPASATTGNHGHKPRCLDVSGQNAAWLIKRNIEIVALDERGASATVKAKRTFCTEVQINLSSYVVPETWDGEGFNETAVPQEEFETDSGVLKRYGDKVELSVGVPDCGNVQTDLYWGDVIHEVDASGHGAQFIAGDLWSTGHECVPPTTAPPTSPPATTVPPTVAPTTPVEQSTSPSPTPVVTVPGTPSPSPIGGLVPPAPPQLAETGSNSTIPLLGGGAILLAAGVLLTLIGRRRRA